MLQNYGNERNTQHLLQAVRQRHPGKTSFFADPDLELVIFYKKTTGTTTCVLLTLCKHLIQVIKKSTRDAYLCLHLSIHIKNISIHLVTEALQQQFDVKMHYQHTIL